MLVLLIVIPTGDPTEPGRIGGIWLHRQESSYRQPDVSTVLDMTIRFGIAFC
jgi:hypothetical protein